jgi:DNA-binding MarR family transcriptional regulator
MSTDFFEDPAHEWRHDHMGRLLLNGFRHFEAYLLKGLQAKGYPEIRPVHLSVMRQMDMGGTRITTIADRARITKQAISQFIAESEDLGLVERRPDPTDGRAKVVCFTDRGLQLLRDSQAIFSAFEADLSDMLGKRAFNEMKAALGVVDRGLRARGL